MEKNPNFVAKIVGNTWDKDGEPIMIETADQCRGVIQFTIDDDAVHSRMYGDVTVGDLGSVLHMLKQTFDADGYATAEKVAEAIAAIEAESHETRAEA